VSELISKNAIFNNPLSLANEGLVIFGFNKKPIRLMKDQLPRCSAVEGNHSQPAGHSLNRDVPKRFGEAWK